MTIAPSRRALLAWLALGSVPTVASSQIIFAQDAEEPDPSDLVPRRFSLRKFLSLKEHEIYKVNLAIRRGRAITIEGYTASQSREIISAAAEDWPKTRSALAETHGFR